MKTIQGWGGGTRVGEGALSYLTHTTHTHHTRTHAHCAFACWPRRAAQHTRLKSIVYTERRSALRRRCPTAPPARAAPFVTCLRRGTPGARSPPAPMGSSCLFSSVPPRYRGFRGINGINRHFARSASLVADSTACIYLLSPPYSRPPGRV